ncbi:MAG: hypothetical protein ACXWMB_02180 [Candidatus Limnocylindria bacterium]
MPGARQIGTILLAAVLLTSCASTIQHPTPGGPKFEDEEIRFTAPTGWQLRQSTSISFGSSQIRLYLANQALRADCDSQQVCQSPLAGGLRPGALFVTWTTGSCAGTTCDLPLGSLISIGNRQGVRVPATKGCEGIGTTEGSVYYVTVTPQRVDALFACARDPSDATRAAFLGFLDAIRWRIP